MRVIVINAVARTVEYRDLADTGAVIGFFPNGISFCGNLATGDAAYIDDEALLNRATHFVQLPCYPMPLPMEVLICGPDSEDGGSTLDVRITPDELRPRIQWVERQGFEAWANDKGRGPAVAISGETIVTWTEMAAKSRPVPA
jgi:hypothetical protein